METRRIRKVVKAHPTVEGAGVHLHRAIGLGPPEEYDPFLLLDDFRSDSPGEYRPGFPWHPHRGMETITYVLRGEVEHRDSLGNRGVISPGDVQWMSAGSIRIVAGTASGVTGPVRDIVTSPEYLDVTVPAGKTFTRATARGHTVFAYVIAGKAVFNHQEDPYSYEAEGDSYFDQERDRHLGDRHLVLFADGDAVVVTAAAEGLRLLLISGKPIGEPIAWRGPIVMNTQEELRVAFEELDSETFIKHPRGAR